MLELRLFGTGQANYNGQPLSGFPDQRASLLFCYLILNAHSHHRERLAAVFWEDVPVAVSRKHLSQTLWRLRQMLQTISVPVEAYLRIDKERIAFAASSDYWLDVEVFEGTITRYQDIPGQKLTTTQANELEQALALYTGDLLEGIYEDWCLFKRERLNLLYLDALGKLMIFHETNKTYEKGLAYGEKILGYDNTRERVHQQIMRLYWLSGQRSAALAQYKHCTQILREELGARPMKATTQLYEQMLNNQFNPTPNNLPNNALSPLVNTEDALQTIALLSLQRLSHLQTIVEETGSELRHLERLIRKTLLDS